MTPTKILSLFLSFCLIFEQSVFAQTIDLSRYFARNSVSAVTQSDKFRPLHLRYVSYDNQANDFKILLDKGDFFNQQTPQLPNSSTPKLEEATQELMKYFFIGLALPNEKFWVNLRPDSPDNILDPDLEKTDIGRIFLEADLQLKKDTSGMTSPQTKEGKEYWDKLYKKAGELFGSENITIPTLTRPWIVPDEVIIRESPEGAYIYKATLKVMLEEDYLNQKTEKPKDQKTEIYSFSDPRLKELNEYSTWLIKEAIIPKLTREINSARRYAPLRQVYYSLILAQWFKQKYSSLGSARASGTGALVNNYIDLIDSGNLANLTSSQPYDKQGYFQQYQKSFKDGEYNLQEPVYTPMGQSIRRYVSGGIVTKVSSHVTIKVSTSFVSNKYSDYLLESRSSSSIYPESINDLSLQHPLLGNIAWKRLEGIGGMFPSVIKVQEDKSGTFTNRQCHVIRGIKLALSYRRLKNVSADTELIKTVAYLHEVGRLPFVHFVERRSAYYFQKYVEITAPIQIGSQTKRRYNQGVAQEMVYKEADIQLPIGIKEDIENLLLKKPENIKSSEAKIFFLADKILGYVEDFVLIYKLLYKGKRIVEDFKGRDEFVRYVFGEEALSEIDGLKMEGFDDYVIKIALRLMDKIIDSATLTINEDAARRLDGYRDMFEQVLFPKVAEIVDPDERVFRIFSTVKALLMKQQTRSLNKREKEMAVVKKLLSLSEENLIEMIGFNKESLPLLSWLDTSQASLNTHKGSNDPDGSMSSPITSDIMNKGGIDLSRINKSIRTESVASPGAGGGSSPVDVDFDLNEELVRLQNLLNAEIVPSASRLDRYARAARASLASSPDSSDSALSLIAETFRLQEEKSVSAPAELKALAAWLEKM